MSKKKAKKTPKTTSNFDPSDPTMSCFFCGAPSRFRVEYECGDINHRHPGLATCKACTHLLAQSTGGSFAIYTKAFEGREEMAQMKADALNAIDEMLRQGRITDGGHGDKVHKKTPPRIPPNMWEG